MGGKDYYEIHFGESLRKKVSPNNIFKDSFQFNAYSGNSAASLGSFPEGRDGQSPRYIEGGSYLYSFRSLICDFNKAMYERVDFAEHEKSVKSFDAYLFSLQQNLKGNNSRYKKYIELASNIS